MKKDFSLTEYLSETIIRFQSSLDAVGFLAEITVKISQFGISVNPISAYYQDHLFVPSEKAHEVMKLLAEFAQ